MAVVSWQCSHSTLKKHPEFKPLGERNYFPSSLLSFQLKVYVLNNLKPEDLSLLFRLACHMKKTDTLHLQDQQQQQQNKEAARQGCDNVAFKRRIKENLCFCKYRCNLQTVGLELCPFKWGGQECQVFKQLGEELKSRKKGRQWVSKT